mmetsp:Transcript_3557/g.5273  ORF Transcript_3557/g.5273 Transcript_3557/m.5273 type:complete len:225 (-) Transcript_3557:1312-1986(-)
MIKLRWISGTLKHIQHFRCHNESSYNIHCRQSCCCSTKCCRSGRLTVRQKMHTTEGSCSTNGICYSHEGTVQSMTDTQHYLHTNNIRQSKCCKHGTEGWIWRDGTKGQTTCSKICRSLSTIDVGLPIVDRCWFDSLFFLLGGTHGGSWRKWSRPHHFTIFEYKHTPDSLIRMVDIIVSLILGSHRSSRKEEFGNIVTVEGTTGGRKTTWEIRVSNALDTIIGNE